MTCLYKYAFQTISLLIVLLFSACSVFMPEERLALFYQRLGRKQLEKNRYSLAEWYLEKSYDLVPRNPVVKQLLPQVYVKLHKTSKNLIYRVR